MGTDVLDIANSAVGATAKEVYTDLAKPAVKPTGALIGLLPRAIKAAVLPLEKWILEKENNLEKIELLLQQKLKDVSPDQIESPEAHVAVPAMQYINYCMDNDELREMYANLLANSMNKVVKKGVHPAYVEIIKQLCPDEAKFLRHIKKHAMVPTITVTYSCEEKEKGEKDILVDFTNVLESIECEDVSNSKKYIDNLVRLGLIERQRTRRLAVQARYAPLKNHDQVKKLCEKEMFQAEGFSKANIEECYVEISAFGKSFCDICVSDELESEKTVE